MKKILLLTSLVLIATMARGDSFFSSIFPSEQPKGVQGSNYVMLDEKSFEIDSDGTWNTCTDPDVNPCSSIKNRADMTDLGNDLKPRFGTERIPVQQLMKIDNEQGPNGETVYKAVNDKFGRIRFVGAWTSYNDTNGPQIRLLAADAASDSNYIEVTYQGTGINLLAITFGGTSIFDNDLDASASTSVTTGSGSEVLINRNYSTNSVYNVESGLSSGWHTTRLKGKTGNNQNIIVYGFEILNEDTSGNIVVSPGSAVINGKKVTYEGGSFAYDIVKTGTKGGVTNFYLKSDGTLGHGWTPADSQSTDLTDVDHSNEFLSRTHFWREGAGRSDDPSTLRASGNDRAFTMDDGLTTLVMNDGSAASLNGTGALSTSADNRFVSFTFEGSGLDVVMANNGAGTNGSATANQIYIDGSLVDNLPAASVGTFTRVQPVVSGLPVGTHIYQWKRNTVSSWVPMHMFFHVYAPKKPAIPSNAIELGEYNIMADFVVNTTAGLEKISTGVMRKDSTREIVYAGSSWAASLSVVTRVGGIAVGGNNVDASASYTFHGIGFDLRYYAHTNGSNNIKVNIDGVLYTGVNGSVNGADCGSWTFGTGVLSQNSVSETKGCSFSVTGLDLEKHTVLFENDNANYFRFGAIDIITPTYAPVNNGPYVVNNTLSVGSNSLKDLRVFDDEVIYDEPFICNAVSIAADTAPSASPYEPMDGIGCTIYADRDMLIDAEVSMAIQSSGCSNKIFIDGVEIGWPLASYQNTGASHSNPVMWGNKIRISKGFHTLFPYWKGTSCDRLDNGGSVFSVLEIN